jgi:hypothetical protein
MPCAEADLDSSTLRSSLHSGHLVFADLEQHETGRCRWHCGSGWQVGEYLCYMGIERSQHLGQCSRMNQWIRVIDDHPDRRIQDEFISDITPALKPVNQ